ncbi:MAG: hypothetical protein F6K28_00700 [Microcoleus sp. SIO2G3]|nr:hypothetical protein [Microcoleus sp. SIO2G3]
MDNRFEPLATGEVLSVDESTQFLIGHHTFRVGEITEAIRMQLEYGISGWSEQKNAWFSEDGIPCEVLRFTAQGWQKGKVRINLEFCPQDFDDEEQDTSANLSYEPSTAAPVDSEDDLDLGVDLGEPALTMEEELNVTPPTPSPVAELDLDVAPPVIVQEEVILVMPPANTIDDLELDVEESPLVMEDLVMEELDQSAPSTSAEPDFDLDIPDTGDEAPNVSFSETVIEVSTFSPEDELAIAQMSTSLDDEFDLGEISESIEQELELVEPPVASDDELLDLGAMDLGTEDIDFGEMSGNNNNDLDDLDFGETSTSTAEFSVDSNNDLDDLDFGETSAGSEEEFEFGDFSLSNELDEFLWY